MGSGVVSNIPHPASAAWPGDWPGSTIQALANEVVAILPEFEAWTTMVSELADLSSSVATLTTSVGTLNSQVEDLLSSVADLTERIETLESA